MVKKRIWWYYLRCELEYAEELLETGWAREALRKVETAEKQMVMTIDEKLEWKLLKSRIHFRLGDCNSALKFAEEVFVEVSKTNNLEVMILAIVRKFEPLYKKGQIKECYKLIKTAEENLEKIKELNPIVLKECRAPIYKSQGNLFFSEGDYITAMEFFLRSVTLYEELNNQYQLMRTLVRLAATFGCMKKYKESTEHYKKAYVISEEIGDYLWQSLILDKISENYTFLGQSNLSTEYEAKSHQLMKKHEYREMKEVNTEIDEYIGIDEDSDVECESCGEVCESDEIRGCGGMSVCLDCSDLLGCQEYEE